MALPKIWISVIVEDDGISTEGKIEKIHQECTLLKVEDCYNVLLCGSKGDVIKPYERIFEIFYKYGICHRFIDRVNLKDKQQRVIELLHEPIPKASKYYFIDWDNNYNTDLPELLRLKEMRMLT